MSTVEESQVRVVPYHSDWPILYENEAQRLRTIRSGIAVDEPPDEARQYANVTYVAAAKSPHSLLGHQNRKRDFVEKLREVARAWAASGDRRT
jgi:GrpB-like predicted nucleotidyltransferase (UPF0157 family)